MNISANTHGYFRVRISTVLLLIAMLLAWFPIVAIWIQLPDIPEEPLYLHNFLAVLFVELPQQLLFISFLIAFVTAVVLAFQRKWRSILQCIIEMLLCFGGTFLIPIY